MGEFSPWHWAIVVLAFVVLFGARRLPDAARGIGQSMRIFKAELKAGSEEGAPPAAQANPAQQTPPASSTTPPPATAS